MPPADNQCGALYHPRRTIGRIGLSAVFVLGALGCDLMGNEGFEPWWSVAPTSVVASVGDRVPLALTHHVTEDQSETAAVPEAWASDDPMVASVDIVEGTAFLEANQQGLTSITVQLDDYTGHIPVLVTGPRDTTTNGPLRVSSGRPAIFEDADGRSVYLVGAHTWSNLQDNGVSDPPEPFDFSAYLDFLRNHGLNFTRLWAWEQATWTGEIEGDYYFAQMLFVRTGPGNALDGKPKWDVTQFDDEYFARIRQRVDHARERGVYVTIALFNGWSVEPKGPSVNNPWRGHPFHRDNNVNGIDGDPLDTGIGRAIHTLEIPEVVAIQQEYVRRVVDAVADLDNAMFEISNESDTSSTAWQYAMVRFIKDYQRGKTIQHLVGMTSEWPAGSNAVLLASPADWIAPRWQGSMPLTQETAGNKVVVYDTDHVCGVCRDNQWAWESFLQGLNVAFMDPYDGRAIGLGARDAVVGPNYPLWDETRKKLGYTRLFAERLDLESFSPQGHLTSTGHCLSTMPNANPEYLVYFPGGEPGWVDLPDLAAPLTTEWFDLHTGERRITDPTAGGMRTDFTPPWPNDAVLYLH